MYSPGSIIQDSLHPWENYSVHVRITWCEIEHVDKWRRKPYLCQRQSWTPAPRWDYQKKPLKLNQDTNYDLVKKKLNTFIIKNIWFENIHKNLNETQSRWADSWCKYILVISLISSAMEVWLASELRAACMWGSWDTNCFISTTVLALWRS